MLTLQGHTFFPSALHRDSVVVDLGANRGGFSQGVRSRFGCRCIAVEANPDLAAALRTSSTIESYQCAIAAADGESALHLSADPEGSSIQGNPPQSTGESVIVPARTLTTFLKEAGVTHVDLLKVDIEGAEVRMFDSLGDADLQRIDQISVEWHDFCGFVTAQDIERVAKRLDRLGFEGIRFGLDNINWVFVRRDLARPGVVRRKYVRYLMNPARNMLHRLRARVGRRM
jgi:FkbM family methyltransferase